MGDMVQPDGDCSLARGFAVLSVAEQEFGVDITTVKEIRLSTPLTLIPRSPPYVLGVVNLRGTVVPIIDLRLRFGLSARDPAARNVVVVVWAAKKLVGLLVDRVVDIVAVADDAVQTTPDIVCGELELVKAIIAVEGRTIGLLELDLIVPFGVDEDS